MRRALSFSRYLMSFMCMPGLLGSVEEAMKRVRIPAENNNDKEANSANIVIIKELYLLSLCRAVENPFRIRQ